MKSVSAKCLDQAHDRLHSRLGDERRPIGKNFADGGPAGGVAGYARGAGCDQRREFLAEALDDWTPAVLDADAEDDLGRRGWGGDDARHAVAAAEGFDVMALGLDAGAAEAVQKHRAAGTRLRR